MYHRRIQVLRLGGSTFLGISIAPPLRGFHEATIKVYTWFVLGFRIAPPPLEFFFLGATIKVYRPTRICLGFRIAPPLRFFFWSHYKSIYAVHFFWSHYKSLYLEFKKGGSGPWIRLCVWRCISDCAHVLPVLLFIRIQRYIIHFLKPERLGFEINTVGICPHDWYQLVKFWLLADRLILRSEHWGARNHYRLITSRGSQENGHGWLLWEKTRYFSGKVSNMNKSNYVTSNMNIYR